MTVASLVLLAVPGAFAAKGWWHVNVISAPAEPADGEGEVVVEASNLGDEWIDATSSHVKIVDVLPAGVVPIEAPRAGTAFEKDPKGRFDENHEAYDEGTNEGASNGNEIVEHMTCKIAGQTVTCEFGVPKEVTFFGQKIITPAKPLLAYESLRVGIVVKVAPGAGTGTNEVSVSGGEYAPSTPVAPVTLQHPLAMGSVPPFGVQSYELTPEEEGGAPDTQAGSHPFQLTATLSLNAKTDQGFHVTFGPEGEPVPEVQTPEFAKDLHFTAPPGLVGNPTTVPTCPTEQFLTGQCSENTAVGVATYYVVGPKSKLGNKGVAPLFNITPSIGEPARFGFQTLAGPIFLDASVRTGSDYAVVITVLDIPESVQFVSTQVTFWGVPNDRRHDTSRGNACLAHENAHEEELHCSATEEKPFLIMPTSCTGPLHTSVEADSWQHIGAWASPFEYSFQTMQGEPFGQDGCNRLSFEPSIVVKPDGQQGSTPTGLGVDVHVAQDASLNPEGLADSNVRSVTVALPEGVAVNPAGGDGLDACSNALIGYLPGESNPPDSLSFTPRLPGSIGAIRAGESSPLSPGVNFCPEASKIGTVKIKTPLLPNEIEGAVYLAAQNANPFGSLVALYLVAEDPVSGVLVKLGGDVKLQEGTGQLVTTFDPPQLPFEDATFHFFGGSRAPLGTPALCGSYTTTARFTPWSSTPTVDVPSRPFQITSGPNGAPCSNPLPFNPSLHASSTNIQAGAFTPYTSTMSRPDGSQNLDAIQLKMPPGLLGTLSGVRLCGEAEGNAGTCGPESLIGETTVSVGLGGTPLSVKGGRVYITGSYRGAPYGLSIVNPAKAGPFDVEHDTSNPNYQPACDCVVVRAKIAVNPITAALIVTTDASGPYQIPQLLDGIPLQIQHVNVTINRPSFTFNPTNCSKMAIGGSLTSTQGATSVLSVPFQVTNCATLAFKPIFNVSTSARTSRKNGASLDVKLSYPKGSFGKDANIAKVKVDLPKQLPSRLTTLQKACTDRVFNTNPAACPVASRVGTATATTPIIPVPLSGPAYFVSHGGAKFPELVIVLSGYGTTVQLHGETFISKAGITSSTFRQIPDVPIGAFELKLPRGTDSALAANANLCKVKSGLKMPTAFTAQNGMAIHQSTPIRVTGCPKAKGPRKTKRAHR